MLTRARAAVLVLAVLTLAGCGSTHPGAAAVVDGKTISMKSLDETAKVYCLDNLRAAKEQKATASEDNAAIRRQTVVTLVALEVARKLAKREGVTPKPSTYQVPKDSRSDVANDYKGVDVDVAIKAVEAPQELALIAVALGEKSTGQKQTAENQQQLTEAGYAEITKAISDYDVTFAPRFGLNDKLKTVAATGSLSVAPTDLGEDKPDQLPAAQRCR